VRLSVRVQFFLLFGLEEETIVRVENYLGQIHKKLFEQATCVLAFFLHSHLIYEDNSHNVFEIADLAEGMISVLEKLGASDSHLRLLHVLILSDVILDCLLEKSSSHIKWDALRHVRNNFLYFRRKAQRL